MKEVSQDVFLRPQVLKTGFCSRDVFVQGCWRGTRAPLLLSPPDNASQSSPSLQGGAGSVQAHQEQHPGLGTVSLACCKTRTQCSPRALS